MKKLKTINPFWAFIAIILGGTLFKHVNFTSFKLADPYFDIVYFIVFVLSIYFLIKDYRSKTQK
jgi:hypothetical protein